MTSGPDGRPTQATIGKSAINSAPARIDVIAASLDCNRKATHHANAIAASGSPAPVHHMQPPATRQHIRVPRDAEAGAPGCRMSRAGQRRRLAPVIVVPDYRGFRIEIVAQYVDGAWNAGVRIRRALSEMKPHVEQVTCRRPSAMEAEQSGEIWAKRWVDDRQR
jgi:hypothetical protein